MTMADREALGVGIIGATGNIGSAYRAEIREARAGRAVALAARRQDLLDAAALEDGAELATADWRAVVQHPDVDLVMVATPDLHHREAALACAEAGKHLFCEKPVGFNAEEALEIRDAYRGRGGLAHFVPFWTRYLAMFARARTLVRDGAVGSVRSVIYRWINPRPLEILFTWRDDPAVSAGGAIADLGSHAYDTIRWILGENAVRVLTHAATISPARPDVGEVNFAEALAWADSHEGASAKRRKPGTSDYASIAWEAASGTMVHLLVSQAPYIRRNLAPDLEVHGTEASLGVARGTGNLVLARAGEEPEVIETHPEVFENRFERFVFPAIEAVRSGEASDHPDLADGYHVQCFTDAAALAGVRGGWTDVK